MNKYILILRMQNFFTNNFNVKICGIYKKKSIYKLYSPVIFLLRFFPFYILSYIFYLFGYQIIYMTNNIYNISYTTKIHITPIILNFSIIHDNTSHDLTNSIKKYSSSIPLKFFLKENNIKKYDKLSLSILQNGNKKYLEINIININCPIYELFISYDTE